ncbi:hypothetical protein EG328_002963 [Venturia inaequalis]|nr:hypothetical protein EG328_002963 [Venturia inaequalis]KAE9994107.1 hypothetical protein EG327_001179 [Venturia inaequalis]
MSNSNISGVPNLPGPSGAQSAPGASTLPPPGPLDSTYPHGNPPRFFRDNSETILEYDNRFPEETSKTRSRRFSPELNLAATELFREIRTIQNRIKDQGDTIFSPIDQLLPRVEMAIGRLYKLFHNCDTIEFEDENIKKTIEVIIPKLLQHAKTVAKNIPKPKPWTAYDMMHHSLGHLCDQVRDAERDSAKWEDVKKTLLEAMHPDTHDLAISFIRPYDELGLINRRIQLEGQRAALAESEAGLIMHVRNLENSHGRNASIPAVVGQLAQQLEAHPTIAAPMTEIRDFYQKYLKGTASEEEIKVYYEGHPFGYMDEADMKWCLEVLSGVLSEKATLPAEKAE